MFIIQIPVTVLLLASTSLASTLIPRAKEDYISSCGPLWMAIADVKTNYGTIQRIGYNTAVDNFCNKAGGLTVAAGAYTSMATRVWLDYGSNPETTGLNGWVYFEIHNKQQSAHVVDAASCKQYLKKLSENMSGNSCYGPKNQDTKGGTWQVGANTISYHALANKLPPSSAVDQIVTQNGAISALSSNGKGNTLDPFPTYAFADAVPVGCHSHNDYERDKAVYSALSAGCVSIEADVWVHSDKLVVGHTDPGPGGQTFVDLYVNPLKKILDERKAIFPKAPTQSLSLLVDFKNSGSNAEKAWDRLVVELKPLRDTGYLSRWDGNAFKQGAITVVGSGNAIKDGSSSTPSPIPRALSEATNPQRAIFVDAVIHKDMSRFDASNAYFASAKWSDGVPKGLPISGDARQNVDEAHAKGFKVRYWAIPGRDRWQEIVDGGVDFLNVDDLQHVAGVKW